ncbi:hypothetical protein [Mycobacterium simiae]|uniref:hypothetical protein n=1 Tax=Mycobacterium simiae TaxID=1784 RepID=UPI00261ED00F|nr:hypothetical protein [Mycobacterium simiae]
MVFCPNPVDWAAVGTVVGATFTGVAAVGTIGTLIYAVKTGNQNRKEANQIRRAETEEKRVAQARRVYAWLHNRFGTGVVRLGNMSDEPVYRVVVYIVYYKDGERIGTGEEVEADLRQLLRSLASILPGVAENAATPPAKQVRAVIQTLPHGTHEVPLYAQQNHEGVEVAFTDAAGRHWVRRVTGELIESHQDAFLRYGIPSPVDYTQLITGGN